MFGRNREPDSTKLYDFTHPYCDSNPVPDTMSYTPNDSAGFPACGATIDQKCRDLQQAKNRGDLGECIALLVLQHSPVEIQRMKQNFSDKIQDITPEYRDRLTKKITEHLLGTYQRIRLLQQQGIFKTMPEPMAEHQKKYWDMAAEQCRRMPEEMLLISGF